MTAGAGGASLRGQSGDARARIDAPRAAGKAPAQADAPFGMPVPPVGVLITLLLERTTRKTSADSGLPPSRTDRDGTAHRGGRDSGKGARPDLKTADSMRRVTVEDTAAAGTCGSRRAGLSGAGSAGRERRVPSGIVSGVAGRRVDAGSRECPGRRARTRGRLPDTMPGPLRHGAGLQAFIASLPVAHMLSLRRAAAMVQAVSGLRLSEATCPGCVRRLHDALQSWEQAAAARLLERPALHAGGTGFRAGGRTPRLHVPADGSLTLRFLHMKRGKEAMEGAGAVPRRAGALVHGCRAPCLACGQCRHRLCGSRLLRGLAFVAGSNGLRRARLMKKLLRGLRRRAGRSGSRTLAEAGRRAARRRCRTVLTRGGKELPGIPPKPEGRRGRIAKSGGRSLHERLAKHGESVLRFMSGPDAGFTDNEGERKIRMAKVRIKVSGRFRTGQCAGAWRRIPGCLSSMAALGCNPLVAIRTAPAGNAAGMTGLHRAQSSATKG